MYVFSISKYCYRQVTTVTFCFCYLIVHIFSRITLQVLNRLKMENSAKKWAKIIIFWIFSSCCKTLLQSVGVTPFPKISSFCLFEANGATSPNIALFCKFLNTVHFNCTSFKNCSSYFIFSEVVQQQQQETNNVSSHDYCSNKHNFAVVLFPGRHHR